MHCQSFGAKILVCLIILASSSAELFAAEADRRDDVVMNGTVVPHVIYEISREDFRKGPLARA